MLPFLTELDVCETVKAVPESIRAGDIIVYDNPSGEELFVHRVVSVEGGCALIKGDNVPREYAERIPLSAIREKVVKLRRGKEEIDLETPLGRTGAILTVWLSKRDITPLLFKKRFIDPILLGVTRNRAYAFIRKLSYKNISFSSSGDNEERRVYAFVGGKKSADAVIKKNGRGVLVSSYIRHRDRNPVFAEKFMHKIVEVSDAEHGSDSHIKVNDKVMEGLVGSTDAFFFNDRVSFK